jgi:uncharacterized protein (DUF2225 family)
MEMCLDHPPKIKPPYWEKSECPYCRFELLKRDFLELKSDLSAAKAAHTLEDYDR